MHDNRMELEPIANFEVAVRLDGPNGFIVVHSEDAEKNIRVQVSGSTQNADFALQGLPQNFKVALDAKYETSFIERYPDVALRTIIRENKQVVEGLRPFSEIKNLLDEACEIKQGNPALEY